MHVFHRIVIGVLLFGATGLCRAQPPIETVQKAKQATAFIEVEEAGAIAEGTAFCFDATGLFVTNAHVVEDHKPGGRIILVLHSGEADQVKVPANVVKLDKQKDLAILKAASFPKNLAVLPLGSSANLVETMSVVAFGYPFGSDLTFKEGDFPAITVSTGHITALRKLDGDLEAVQLDASLNEGNSGGPIIDTKGEVIAIVMEGIPGSGINLAIPVSHLHSFIRSLGMAFVPPTPKAGHLRDKATFTVELLAPASGKERATVELTLSSSAGPKRTVKAETEDGKTYTAEISLLPGITGDIPDHVTYQITATRGGQVIASDDGKISLKEDAPGGAPGAVGAERRSGRELLVSCSESNDIRRFDTNTGQYLGSFAAGNSLQGARDMLTGPDGTVYVAVVNSVRAFDGKTGQLLGDFVKSGAGGLSSAQSMAVGPDRNLYVASQWDNCIKRYSGKTGDFLGNVVMAGGLVQPNCMRFGKDGLLYVSSGANVIKRYDARTGVFIDDFVGGNGLVPGAFTWGLDGNLYVCSFTNDVRRFDGRTGQFIDKFIRPGAGLNFPISITFGSNGIVYIGDKSSTIRRYSARTGEFIDVFATGNGMQMPVRMLFR